MKRESKRQEKRNDAYRSLFQIGYTRPDRMNRITKGVIPEDGDVIILRQYLSNQNPLIKAVAASFLEKIAENGNYSFSEEDKEILKVIGDDNINLIPELLSQQKGCLKLFFMKK